MSYRRRTHPHLEMRHRTYLAVLEIPKPLRAKLGRSRFIKSLETDSLSVAERLAAPLVAAWRQTIAEARAGGVAVDDMLAPWPDAQQLAKEAAFLRRALRDARTEPERVVIRDRAADLADDIDLAHGDEAPDGTPLPSDEAAAFYASATGLAFDDYADEWLSASRVTAKTRDMQRADLTRFAVAFPTVADVTKPGVKRWATALMAGKDALTAKTVQRILSALRGYWRHLQSIEVVPEALEPFARLDVGRKGGRVMQDDRRQAFTPAEVVTLLAAARGDDEELADVIDMARWTGARIEELCALKVDRVYLDAPVPFFRIGAGKTDAAIREVPVHANLLPALQRLIGNRTAGYVLADLTPNKYGDRSNSPGKRFGRLKTRKGFGEQHVFHSIRKTVATMFKNASVPEATAADILGHDIATMTYGLYAGNVSLAVKAAAIAKLAYPAAE